MRIAVVIAVRNGAHTLDETLRSIQTQTRAADEIWIVDDASTDSTQERLRAAWIKTPNFYYERLENRRGPAGARNYVLNKINADWMLPLDADDLLLTSTLATFEAKAQITNADLLYGDIWENKNGSKKRISYPQIPPGIDGMRFILRRGRIPFKHSACLFRLSVLHTLGGYDESLALKTDVDLILRLLALQRTAKAIHTLVLEHFVHTSQMSRQRFKGIASYSSMIKKIDLSETDRLKLLAQRSFWEMSKAMSRR